eukprot:4524943-Prymnesium_polylepis.1
MSGWDNLEGNNTAFAYRCARGRKREIATSWSPTAVGLDHVPLASSLPSVLLARRGAAGPTTRRHHRRDTFRLKSV